MFDKIDKKSLLAAINGAKSFDWLGTTIEVVPGEFDELWGNGFAFAHPAALFLTHKIYFHETPSLPKAIMVGNCLYLKFDKKYARLNPFEDFDQKAVDKFIAKHNESWNMGKYDKQKSISLGMLKKHQFSKDLLKNDRFNLFYDTIFSPLPVKNDILENIIEHCKKNKPQNSWEQYCYNFWCDNENVAAVVLCEQF